MNRKKALVCFTISLMLLLQTGLAKATESNLVSHYWDRHDKGINGIIKSWQNQASPEKFGPYLQDLVSSETALISTGLSPLDKRLVGRLFDTPGPLSPDIMAYRIFRWKFRRQAQWGPSHDAIYKNKIFILHPKGAPSKTFTVKTKTN